MIDLKRCPFCGGEARIMLEDDAPHPDDYFHNIYCTSCGVQFWVKSKTEAIKKWNKRESGNHAHVIVDWLGDCKCSKCDRNIDCTSNYCNWCGAELDEPEQREN